MNAETTPDDGSREFALVGAMFPLLLGITLTLLAAQSIDLRALLPGIGAEISHVVRPLSFIAPIATAISFFCRSSLVRIDPLWAATQVLGASAAAAGAIYLAW